MNSSSTPLQSKVAPPWGFSILFILIIVCWSARLFPNLYPELWPILLAFGFFPILDGIVGLDTENPKTEEEERYLSSLWRYKILPCLWLPFAICVLADILWQSEFGHTGFSWRRAIAVVLSLGIANGALGINISHELIHKNGIERFVGRLMLVLVCYGHWEFEHISGHHKRVATADDPATAKRGQTVYAFWWQSVVGTLKSGWAIESKFCSDRGLPFWMNRCLLSWSASALLGLVIATQLGYIALSIWLAQSFVSISLLEVVNYIEHYGLLRQPKEAGGFEAVRPVHSWDSGFAISNYLLFKLQRHADHHTNPQRRYQILKLSEESPKMPFGYPTMVPIALIPPLWFYLINPILDEFNARQQKQH